MVPLLMYAWNCDLVRSEGLSCAWQPRHVVRTTRSYSRGLSPAGPCHPVGTKVPENCEGSPGPPYHPSTSSRAASVVAVPSATVASAARLSSLNAWSWVSRVRSGLRCEYRKESRSNGMNRAPMFPPFGYTPPTRDDGEPP